jgi:hypothetical protein
MSIEELGQIRTKSNLKTTINLTLVDESDFDADKLEKYFDKEHFFVKLSPINPTIEHILSQTPKFTPKSFGFRDEDEFEEFEGIIGNLTILEKSINSSIQKRLSGENKRL